MGAWKRNRRGPPEKFIGYYDLLDALTQPGCAICRRADHAARSVIDALLYEAVNDPRTRERLRTSGGFCRHHARMAADIGDALAMSILYKDLLGAVLEELRSGRDLKIPGVEDCLICKIVLANEKRSFELFIRHLKDEEFSAALHEADPLCVHHYCKLDQQIRPAQTRETLRRWEEGALAKLHSRLSEFVRKGDYRYRHEKVAQEEASSWRRTVEWFVGRGI